MHDIEHRRTIEAELRTVRNTEEGQVVLEGHAAVFNQETVIAGLFREQVAPGAFAEALRRGDDVRALYNHNTDNLPLGRTAAGTLELREDDVGLATRIMLPDTRAAADLAIAVERGDVDQMSFGFRTEDEEWDESDPAKLPLRTLTQVALFDVSPVTFAAYPQTDIGLAKRAFGEYRSRHPAPTPKLTRARLALRLAQRGS